MTVEMEPVPCHRCRGTGLEPSSTVPLTPAQAKLWGYLQDAGVERQVKGKSPAERAANSARIRQLAERAKTAGLTQEQMATALGLTRAAVHSIRNGKA